MKSGKLKIEVLPLQFVERRVSRGGISAVLSILGPRETTAEGMFRFPEVDVRHEHAKVSDIHFASIWNEKDILAAREEGLIEVTDEHVRQILRFGTDMIELANKAPDDVTIIVHCHAGHSRSPAGALLIMAMTDGPGNEELTAKRIFQMVPGCHPNPMFVRIGDRLLGRKGALEAAVNHELDLDRARQASKQPSLIIF